MKATLFNNHFYVGLVVGCWGVFLGQGLLLSFANPIDCGLSRRSRSQDPRKSCELGEKISIYSVAGTSNPYILIFSHYVLYLGRSEMEG